MYLASVYIIMNGNNSMWMGGLGKYFLPIQSSNTLDVFSVGVYHYEW